MFRLFRFKNPYEQAAKAQYVAAMERVQEPVFYQDYGVPDTMDGRFDLLLVHIFPLVHAGVKAQDGAFSQALFDMTFHHLDQTLRQAGIGDMGVPKRMRRMMKAFNGRMNAYEQACEAGDFEEALKRNLYGTIEAPAPDAVKRMVGYMEGLVARAEAASFDDIKSGKNIFPALQTQKYGT